MEFDLSDIFPADVCTLVGQYLGLIKTDADKRARIKIFRDFHETTGTDMLRAAEDDFLLYADVLRKRIEEKEMKLGTALRNQRILSAFAQFLLKRKGTEGSLVPDSFTDKTGSSRMEEPPEQIYFKDVPGLSDIDTLIGYLRARCDNQTLAAVMLSFKCHLKTGAMLPLKKADIMDDANGDTYIMADDGLPRRIPADVAEVIDKALASIPEGGYLFSTGDGEQISLDGLEKRLKRACVKAGIGAVSFNRLRNAGAVISVANGADPAKLADSMGYKNHRHIKKLTSLPMHFIDTGQYVNIDVKNGPAVLPKEENE